MPGDMVVRQGDIGEEMFFIREGECECSVLGKGVVRVVQEGEFFGELALFMTGERMATVSYVTDARPYP
eukprot:COSAG05_NODE_23_length_31591_cov_92.542995_13_plen_69_part_00